MGARNRSSTSRGSGRRRTSSLWGILNASVAAWSPDHAIWFDRTTDPRFRFINAVVTLVSRLYYRHERSPKSVGPQGVGGLRASAVAIVRIRATAGRWTRAGDCEDWSAACLTCLTLDAAERAQRPADESVLRRAPADRIVMRSLADIVGSYTGHPTSADSCRARLANFLRYFEHRKTIDEAIQAAIDRKSVV